MRSACGSIAIVVCGLVPVLGAGQEPTREANLAFEVASVKANPSGTVVLPDGRVATGTNIGSAGGRFSAQNASLHTLVSLAYGIQEFRISGGPRWMRTRPPHIHIVGTGTMEQLAAFLATSMRSPVVDGTGLDGAFDISVEFMSETFAMSMKGGERDAWLGLPSAPVPPDPELANALKTQLGLQIETQRRPIEVLVIDGASQPSDN